MKGDPETAALRDGLMELGGVTRGKAEHPEHTTEDRRFGCSVKLRADLAEARKVAAEWRDIADLQFCLADSTFPGLNPDDPESYAFPWEKDDA